MNTQPLQNDDNNEYYYGIKLPFDGFVNVNDIIRKRRSLRDAGFADSDAVNVTSVAGDLPKENE